MNETRRKTLLDAVSRHVRLGINPICVIPDDLQALLEENDELRRQIALLQAGAVADAARIAELERTNVQV